MTVGLIITRSSVLVFVKACLPPSKAISGPNMGCNPALAKKGNASLDADSVSIFKPAKTTTLPGSIRSEVLIELVDVGAVAKSESLVVWLKSKAKSILSLCLLILGVKLTTKGDDMGLIVVAIVEIPFETVVVESVVCTVLCLFTTPVPPSFTIIEGLEIVLPKLFVSSILISATISFLAPKAVAIDNPPVIDADCTPRKIVVAGDPAVPPVPAAPFVVLLPMPSRLLAHPEFTSKI